MIAVAVSLNLVIALFCFYVAWRVWRLSKTLGAVADALVNWERNTHNVLNPAVVPPAILRGQSGTAYLRQSYGLLQFQLQRLEQVMGIVGLLPMANRWLSARGRRPGSKIKTSLPKRR
ncbi:hypothetical protein IQ265_14495 [Nodosilinea sp. LEGE 06152]|uniref:hypothetical protein n=1 Tax=Nodosilinea sp. LEGE 06152 TaxID=2777966 RepID=UPI001881443E|nr:hypothetical protein [Nodosilinea sp. LEGE 06152]MBE9158025.1 hypothetical protein [Nodosilinea sp. LEGE 06152]